MAEVAEFDLYGEIHREGRVSIEASAGTGKTYTLAALVTRYVAETDISIDQILVVTFGRLAARELRETIRSQIARTSRALSDLVASDDIDEITEHLASFDLALHRDRLNRALLDFDTSAITTIHSFAQQMRSILGISSGLDLEAELKDDADEIVSEVVSDVLSGDLLRGEGSEISALHLKDSVKSTLIKLAKIALGNPGITILPEPDAIASGAVHEALAEALGKRRLLDAVLKEIAHRRRQRRTLSYDDVLIQLRDVIRESRHAVEQLRRRFPVVLVDEFQDTDQVQWEIFERLFGSSGSGTRLVVVGDPKQAIYGFRGANVYSYLRATLLENVEHFRLSTNYRSDGALLSGLDRLFHGVTFGHAAIAFQSVRPSESHRLSRLVNRHSEPLPALSIRTALSQDLQRGSGNLISTDAARTTIAEDLSCVVQNLLEAARIPVAGSSETRSARPNDIAVLISRNAEAIIMQHALRERGIPAVIRQGLSILNTEAELQWRLLMSALAQPSNPDRARRAALGWFFMLGVDQICADSDEALREVQQTLLRWSDVLSHFGIVDFCSVVWSESNVMSHVLGLFDGDRKMTDLNQIVGLLHRSDQMLHMTPDSVLRALDELNGQYGGDLEEDLLSQQIESEAKAVQIMTIHKSKGLQFPIVCVPSMWHAVTRGDFYQDFDRDERVLAVDRSRPWPSSSDFRTRQQFALNDAVGEDLRLLYVALTRAEHQTIVWWTRVKDNQSSGLARVLFAGGEEPAKGNGTETVAIKIPDDALVRDILSARYVPDDASNAVSVVEVGEDRPLNLRWVDSESEEAGSQIEVAPLQRTFTRINRRWSFSAMYPVDRPHSPNSRRQFSEVAERHTRAGADDEPITPIDPDAVFKVDGQESDLPLGSLSGGPEFGTLVHEVLQEIDFTVSNLERELDDSVSRRMRWRDLRIERMTLVRGLRLMIESPLGPQFAERRLRDFGRNDRLDELGFEIRLGDGRHHANIRDIGAVLSAHLAPDDPMRVWSERVRDGLFDEGLAGHLTGSIDLVVRIPGVDAESPDARYVLADYKTNILSELSGPPKSADYRPSLLPAAMEEHNYPLQAALYGVALHRYLRWRVPRYDPGVHFGGAAFLFLRGLQGPDTPREGEKPYGVFSWRISKELISDLSDSLDGSLELSQ